MNLDEKYIDKIAPQLEDALLSAKGNEVLRVVMVLDSERGDRESLSQQLDPSQFPNRTAWRQALIQQRQNHLAEAIGDTIKGLQNLSLTTHGGVSTNIVVVEGAASHIASALELPGVRHASLNQPVRLIPNVPPETVENLANTASKIIEEAGDEFPGLKGKSLDERTRQSIFQAAQQYIQKYMERHGKVQILGMRQPVGVESIYTDVQFLNEWDTHRFASTKGLEEIFRQSRRQGFSSENYDKREGIKVANETQYLMVLGEPGTGKSTFLRKIGLEALKQEKAKFKHECIPVFIELKRLNSGDVEVARLIAYEFRLCGFPSPEEFTTTALKQGKLLILLDGLDEVPTRNIDAAIQQIHKFVDTYSKNRLIASCRAAAYHGYFRHFTNATIADFDDKQIQHFIACWFHSELDKQSETAHKCWTLLQETDNSAAKKLARTPLLLTFLCLVYDHSQGFPNNRSVLYRKAIHIFLEEWAANKKIEQDETIQELTTNLEEVLLSEIAYKGFEQDKLFFKQAEIISKIKDFFVNNLNVPQHLEAEAVLNIIEVQQGILVERAEDVYSFSHLTIQEYLNAKYIYDHRETEISKLVAEHLTDERWQEIFLLLAGLMDGGADELLLPMEKTAQNYINPPKLQALLSWAELATDGSKGNYHPVAKRAVAILIADAIANANLNFIATDLVKVVAIDLSEAATIAISIADAIIDTEAIADDIIDADAIAFAIDLARELEKREIFKEIAFSQLIVQLQALKAQVPDDKKPSAVLWAFIERLQQTWLKALNLTPEIIHLSEEEANALSNYLYANSLIVRCKEAAVRVSPKTWKTIEEKMLLVPGN